MLAPLLSLAMWVWLGAIFAPWPIDKACTVVSAPFAALVALVFVMVLSRDEAEP